MVLNISAELFSSEFLMSSKRQNINPQDNSSGKRLDFVPVTLVKFLFNLKNKYSANIQAATSITTHTTNPVPLFNFSIPLNNTK